MAESGELNLDSSAFPTQRYEPIRLLGKGALGEVYLAKDRTLGRTVAVKCLLTVTDDQVVSFHREAKIASKLSHAHVISSLDFGTTDSGRPYLALEYFDGVSLEDFLAHYGHLDEELVTRIFIIVAEALSYIHSHKIFHRDLKPSNILIKVDENSIDVRIIDFGLSSIKEEFQTKTLMQGRTLVGTPLYMSPDQVSGGVYDARSEVYSLACLMFESLAGRPPFPGDTPLVILDHHLNALPPRLHEVRPDLSFSDGMQNVLDQCLAKSKSDRFQTMDDLVDALQHKNTFTAGDEKSRNQKKRLRFRWAMTGSVFIALIMLATGAFVMRVLDGPDENESSMLSQKFEDIGLKTMGDPVTYLTEKSPKNGFYIWGEENAERLKNASENGKPLEIITLRGLKLDAKTLDYLIPLKPKSLYINHCEFDSIDTMERISKLGSIDKLGFYTCGGITPSSLAVLKNLSNLDSLILESCELNDEHLSVLSKLEQVKQFVLDGNDAITINGIKGLARTNRQVAVWVDSGSLAKLPLQKIEKLKRETGVVLITKSMEKLNKPESQMLDR